MQGIKNEKFVGILVEGPILPLLYEMQVLPAYLVILWV